MSMERLQHAVAVSDSGEVRTHLLDLVGLFLEFSVGSTIVTLLVKSTLW